MALEVVGCVGHHSGHIFLASLVLHFEYIFHHGLLVGDSLVPQVMVMICSFAFPSLHLREYHSRSLLEAFLLDDFVVVPT